MIGIQTTAFFLISYQNFLEFDRFQEISYELFENVERADDVSSKAKNYIGSYIKYKIRSQKRQKLSFENAKPNTGSCVKICSREYIERNNLVKASNLFRHAYKADRMIRIQSITTLDL